MLCYRSIRVVQCRSLNILNNSCISQAFCTDSSDDEKKAKKVTKVKNESKKNEALKKLNLLLKTMVEEDQQALSKKKLDLARPKMKVPKIKQDDKSPQDIITAAKDVAKSLGGDVKQTESELLNKLLSPVDKNNEDPEKKPLNLSEIIVGMKIDRTSKEDTSSTKGYVIRQITDQRDIRKMKLQGSDLRRPIRPPLKRTENDKIDLFGGEGLGIFKKDDAEIKEEPILKTWERLHKRELELAVTHPPANYFEEMMLWTKQGKLWTFPINNEIGMKEEENVYFADHVFLEKHLEPWCPSKGPVRHFMELVCVGLSKNPYLTVQAKREHIEWFENYFSSKDQILREIGAIPADFKDIKQLDG